MVDTTELRIGNHINKLDNAVQVDAELIVYLCSGSMYLRAFEPILLEEKHLLEFGFKQEATGDETCYKGDFEIYLPNYFKYKDSVLIKIEHVHQLQNLHFALTGKELTRKKASQFSG